MIVEMIILRDDQGRFGLPEQGAMAKATPQAAGPPLVNPKEGTKS